jgi:hypothetical protein
VNPASALLALQPGLERGRANQPDPTFPQLPGIILEPASSFLTAAAYLSGVSSFLSSRFFDPAILADHFVWNPACAICLSAAGSLRFPLLSGWF